MKTRNLFLLTVLLSSCQPEDATPNAPIQDDFDTSKATLIRQGMLIGVGHTASGTASLYDANGAKVIVLDPYASQNGPDLKVYLSKDDAAKEYVKLGNLKSTMGKQVYEVPANLNSDEFGYVHIWCEKYTVVFAIAALK